MSIITKPHGDFAPLTIAEAAKVNDQVNTIYSDHNGGITDTNIAALANIQQGKILGLPADLTTIRNQKVQEINVVTFLVNGTYAKPVDLIFAHVICIAGGGGGGGVQAAGPGATRVAGGGGQGGRGESFLMAASFAAIETVTIGGFGAGGDGAIGQVGSNGGDVALGTLCSAIGGLGGNFSGVDNTPCNGNSGGGSLNAQIITQGSPGGHGWAQGGQGLGGSGGGQGGGQGAIAPSNGQTAPGFGGGGGGAASGPGGWQSGGSGGRPVIYIIEYKA